MNHERKRLCYRAVPSDCLIGQNDIIKPASKSIDEMITKDSCTSEHCLVEDIESLISESTYEQMEFYSSNNKESMHHDNEVYKQKVILKNIL